MNLIHTVRQDFKYNKLVYAMALPILVYFILFKYIPMAGIIMAFQDYSLSKGILGSSWVGFKNFIDFFNSYYFFRLLKNTALLSFYDLVITFPIPILFALLLNEVKNKRFKQTIQTISYMPYFISLVVISGIIAEFCSSEGVITRIIALMGGPNGNLLGNPNMFRTIYIGSNIWEYMGYSSIIYLAALSTIDSQQYEAAMIDGANRFKQIWHITIPGLMPTIMILFILRMGMMMTVGFEKVLLLYTPATYSKADIIATFTYRKGISDLDFSFSTAVGLFNSIINTGMLLMANWLSKKTTDTSLF